MLRPYQVTSNANKEVVVSHDNFHFFGSGVFIPSGRIDSPPPLPFPLDRDHVDGAFTSSMHTFNSLTGQTRSGRSVPFWALL
jgi:hypothetical protein